MRAGDLVQFRTKKGRNMYGIGIVLIVRRVEWGANGPTPGVECLWSRPSRAVQWVRTEWLEVISESR